MTCKIHSNFSSLQVKDSAFKHKDKCGIYYKFSCGDYLNIETDCPKFIHISGNLIIC